MDWLDHFNHSIAYVEENLAKEINLAQAAQLAQCSSYHYQRMFSYIANVTLGGVYSTSKDESGRSGSSARGKSHRCCG